MCIFLRTRRVYTDGIVADACYVKSREFNSFETLSLSSLFQRNKRKNKGKGRDREKRDAFSLQGFLLRSRTPTSISRTTSLRRYLRGSPSAKGLRVEAA